MTHDDFARILTETIERLTAGKNGKNKIRREIKHMRKHASSALKKTNKQTARPLKKTHDNLVMTRVGATVATAKADSHT